MIGPLGDLKQSRREANALTAAYIRANGILPSDEVLNDLVLLAQKTARAAYAAHIMDPEDLLSDSTNLLSHDSVPPPTPRRSSF